MHVGGTGQVAIGGSAKNNMSRFGRINALAVLTSLLVVIAGLITIAKALGLRNYSSGGWN